MKRKKGKAPLDDQQEKQPVEPVNFADPFTTIDFASAEACEEYFASFTDEETPGKRRASVSSDLLKPLEEEISKLEGSEGSLIFGHRFQALYSILMLIAKEAEYFIACKPLSDDLSVLVSRSGGTPPLKMVTVDAGERVGQNVLDAVEREDNLPGMIYLASPAGPESAVTDLSQVADIAGILGDERGSKCYVVVDNSRLGPWFQQPLRHGVDLVVSSFAEYIGGNAELAGGHISGGQKLTESFMEERNSRGWFMKQKMIELARTCMETGFLRKRGASENAAKIASVLSIHPEIKKAWHPSLFKDKSRSENIFSRQCEQTGGRVSFDLGSKEKAFGFLNTLNQIRISPFPGRTGTVASHARYHRLFQTADAEHLDGVVTIIAGVENFHDLMEEISGSLKKL